MKAMKTIKRLVVLTLSLLLVSCSYNTKKQQAFSDIEHHAMPLVGAYYYKDQIYLQYQFEGETFYLTGDLKNPEPERAEPTVVLHPKRSINDEKMEKVVVVGKEWGNVLKEVILTYLPEKPGQGRLLFIQNFETLLYRRADGTPDLTELDKAPADVEVIGRVDAAEFRARVEEQLKKDLAQAGITHTKFLLRLDGVPLTPYVYVDTATDSTIELELPPYYQLEKEMSTLGFSLTFVYSFAVKSHFLGIIKAPFTSLHRLFAWGTSTVYTALPPHYSDLKTVPPLNQTSPGMDLTEFNRWLDKKISKQNYKARVKLLIDGEEFFPHFILAAQRATESIFIRVYIFATDPYGLKIADLLKERAADGVDVRVLTDELNTILNSAKEPELHYKADFVMPKSIKSYLRKNSHAKARTHWNTWATFDHSKVFLIDRQLAYTGGMNIGEEYRYTWHDMMISLEGPVVGRLVKNFYESWSFAGWGGDFSAAYRKLFSKKQRDANKAEPGMVDVRLMYTKPNDPEIFHAQIEAIKRAEKRIYIENAYFSDDRIIGELIKARGRGVDVRIILPGKNDVGIMYKNNQLMANKMFRNGIRVYFYNGMSHVKAALYDGWAVIGSSNFDKMSLFINNEMSVGIDDPTFVDELETRLFEKDFADSTEMDKELELGWSYFIVDALTNQL